MEEEIKAEFKKNGFTLDEEEEILNKCECDPHFALESSPNLRKLV